MARSFLAAGALFGLLSVALGAFAAHGLQSSLSADLLNVFHTGVQYQMYHALALLFTGLLVQRAPSRSATVAGWLFVIGIVLFSGSLYVLALTQVTAFGIVTPLGGLAFLAGWFALFMAALSVKSQ